jgi:hypothetical protein
MSNDGPFTFAISLSVLNHLGRNLYRSFITVLGEAISNSWDADAKNVWININKDNNSFVIVDDGDGMTSFDFQNKFLKIGYSKRHDGKTKSDGGRPFIGRKGIGKLALLSCSDSVVIISRTGNGDYIGGEIDNSGLDDAIKDDLEPSQYELREFDIKEFGGLLGKHEKGTAILFKNLREGVRSSIDYLRKSIALYFRFSLLDGSFSIYLNDIKITLDDLSNLAEKTQFVWVVNNFNDPYLTEKLSNVLEKKKLTAPIKEIKGFVASVEKPLNLKIFSTEERAGLDLFVNGRLRERDILKHIPTARVVESYLYGQIHYNEMDDSKDRFTSSREGVISDDPKFTQFLKTFSGLLRIVLEDWDLWRNDHRQDGDPDNPRLTKKERSSRSLYNAIVEDYVPPDAKGVRKKVDSWVDDLAKDARYNFESYAECFVSENLIRKHIESEGVVLTEEAKRDILTYKNKEKENKERGNVSIDIRKTNSDLAYLPMDGLANLVDKAKDVHRDAGLSRDAVEYKPIRDALMHTSLLTDEAKTRLTTTSANIKGRVKTLLGESKSEQGSV